MPLTASCTHAATHTHMMQGVCHGGHHTSRDSFWLATGLAVGVAAGYALVRIWAPAAAIKPTPCRDRLPNSCSTASAGRGAFTGKEAVVTGAASGIGRAISIALSDAGATVIAIDSDAANLMALNVSHPGIRCGVADTTDATSVEAAMATCHANSPHLLVNCAAITVLEPFLDVKLSNFQRVLKVNVEGTLIVSQIVARRMVAAGQGGAILTLSSLASMVAVSEHTSYCSSKGAIDALTRMMALELGPHGIRVNSLNPTLVNSGMGKWAGPEAVAGIAARVPLGRIAEEDDVVTAALFLLQSEMISGHSLPLDGGTITRL